MRTAVIGGGFVGVTQALGLAHLGHDVTVVDSDPMKVRMLRGGVLPFDEPGLPAQLKANPQIVWTGDYDEARTAQVAFICVGTPNRDGRQDLGQLFDAVDALSQVLPADSVIAVKSTVLPGTCRMVQDRVAHHYDTDRPAVVANPEFLAEGSAWNDWRYADKIVVGTNPVADLQDRQQAATMVRSCYGIGVGEAWVDDPFDEAEHSREWHVGWETAEMAKYASNVLLAARLSTVNDLALAAETLGADWPTIRATLDTDSRIGGFLYPGPGFGGSCLPKDVEAFNDLVSMPTLAATLESNRFARQRWLDKAMYGLRQTRSSLPTTFAGQVTIWGLAYKPHTNDTRESAGVWYAEQLAARGIDVVVHDPMDVAVPVGRRATDLFGSLDGSNVLIIATDHDDYRPHWSSATVAQMVGSMTPGSFAHEPLVLDTRAVLSNVDRWRQGGATVTQIGTG